ncbi:hypothetical protein GJ689_24730 [Rhodoplanes serenus]|uniref:P22 coat protein-protein 5 domain protein n=1 Tax=Rhodoplanes serenus TaxID=200615 RepID=A0A9X5AVD1_9BRAD|nr:P22 phage major capsid protein family protein [Rhodoplanes serenus]MTW19400.1 hypothetical protein [Rhodoplanes serenus]
MANKLITPSVIAKEALMQLENNLVFANRVHREYKKEFVKVGDTVSIRRPVKFYAADGATLVKQDVEEGSTAIKIDQRKHVGWEFSSQDLTLTIEKYSERYIQPACITLAQVVDQAVASLYKKVWNSVGTPGTTPANFAALGSAAQRLDEMAVPAKPRAAVVNPAAGWTLAGGQTALYMADVAKSAYREGTIGDIAGFDTFRSQNVRNHVVGTKAGTPLVNGANQSVTYQSIASTGNKQSLVTDAWTPSSAVLKAGDVFTIAGVYAVNPVPGEGTTGKQVMPYLQQFVALADATADGSGNATLSISPAIITSGAQQTVSNAPADNAAIAVLGTASTAYPQNLCFSRNAFALVTVPLIMPDSAAFKAQESHNGLSIRVVKDFDITTDKEIIRLDVMFGVEAIYPDLAVRLWG